MERFVAVKYEVAWEACRDRVWVVAACRAVQPAVLCVVMKLGVKELIKLCIYCWGHPLLYTFSGSVAVWMLLSGNLQHVEVSLVPYLFMILVLPRW
jgi:hypothetical protein